MTNQEVVRALSEYVQLEQRLSQLLKEKKRLEKGINYYQVSKSDPEPVRPSKIAVFLPILCCSIIAAFILAFVILNMTVRDIKWIMVVLCAIVLAVIIAHFQYKKANAKACADFVVAKMEYENWKSGRENELPKLQKKYNEVMREGGILYNRFQNAEIRSLLHPDYLRYTNTILSYFQRGRVQNLRDAVNLLEQERREHRRDMETAAYRKEIQQQAYAQREAAEEAARQGRRAADAAEEAAFWGAAATFVAATNNKKSSDDNDFRVV